MKKTKIVLLRHGKTAWNIEKRIQGKKDIPLLLESELEVKNLVPKIKHLDIKAVYTSPLTRAKRTGEIIKEELNIEGFYTIEDLSERDFGSHEGKTAKEIGIIKGYISLDDNLEGAEKVEDLKKRVVGALTLIAQKHMGETVLVVSHGGSMRAMLKHAGREKVETIPNNVPFILEVWEDKFDLVKTPEDFT